MVNVAASSDHILGRKKEKKQGVLLFVGQLEDKMSSRQQEDEHLPENGGERWYEREAWRVVSQSINDSCTGK